MILIAANNINKGDMVYITKGGKAWGSKGHLSMVDINVVRTVNFLDEIFNRPFRCLKGCHRSFDTKRGEASHRWRCKGYFNIRGKRIRVPKLVCKI